ncbi:dihydrofolate reductase family protein [Curtobacterium sp. RRHDQ10]|uniref:dihydrofolate reductase family protein n=1 Tax=Curtobacterium phyllosphaerae TaxID=3413379 RepID=UPI003BF3BA65
MSRVRVHNFAISLDGYGAGADQSLEHPFGHADGRLMGWFAATATFRPLVMAGGTTFHFVDASPAEALRQARAAAPGLDVRIGGGVETVREFLAADLVDHLHVVVVPIVLGCGEQLWDGLEGLEDRFDIESVASPSGVVHRTFRRRT